MRFLLIFFMIFFVTECSKEKLVYWCGDHACVNEKERVTYFEKTMTIEMRKANDNTKKDKEKAKEIKEKLKAEKKYKTKKAKEMKKQAKINKKLEIQSKKEGKKEKLFESNVKYNNKIKLAKKRVVKKKRSIKIKSFDQISKIITNENKKKSYPDINRVPE